MKKKTTGLIKEFKEFISRGNVIDLAVGIIIGNAFTAIVNSVVGDMVMPLIGWIIGGVDFKEFKLVLPEVIPGTKPAEILYGSFINQVINFLIIALVVFIIVKLMNTFRRKKEQEPEEKPAEKPAVSAAPEDIQLLTEIRDLLRERTDKD